MPELIMLCGIPTSGKSTFSKDPKYKDYVRISSDDILQEIAKNKETTYDAVFSKYINIAQKAMMKLLKNAVKDGKSIIWDQTNIDVKQRYEKLKFIPKEYKKTAVYFIIPLKDAIQRNKQREGKTIPPEVIESMCKKFQIPSIKEGFDQVIKGN